MKKQWKQKHQKMELKKFKQLKESINQSLLSLETGYGKLEVKKIDGLYVVMINGQRMESFNTKEAAEEAAKYAQDSLTDGNEDE